MEFAEEFERDFMKRTLQLLMDYPGEYEATLLLNCLLGLLVVPKETSLEKIPTDPISEFHKWGISPESIKSFGRMNRTNQYPETLRGVVYNLRNSVAHFRIRPVEENSRVRGFSFTDMNGFAATIDIKEMRSFVERLASYLERSIKQ